jgi:hypothetical protein
MPESQDPATDGVCSEEKQDVRPSSYPQEVVPSTQSYSMANPQLIPTGAKQQIQSTHLDDFPKSVPIWNTLTFGRDPRLPKTGWS